MNNHIDVTTLRTLMLRCSGDEDSAGALLRDLAHRLFESADADNCDPDGINLLAEMGTGWEDAFGCRVREHSTDEGVETFVEWGTGDAYCWTTLGDVIDHAASPNTDFPDWWDSDWTEVRDEDGRWRSRAWIASQQVERKNAH